MKRAQAIEKLAFKMLKELSENERLEKLETMMLEDWSENADWNVLPKDIQNEANKEIWIGKPNDTIYDQVLMIWFRENLKSVTNQFICKKLAIESIIGEPIKLLGCPCCGSCTIEERGNFDICSVCWWEDDGQDNKDADKIFGGPNQGVSLTQARYNFIKFGIYDPERKDLMEKRDLSSKYETGRRFEIDGGFIRESGTSWKSQIK